MVRIHPSLSECVSCKRSRKGDAQQSVCITNSSQEKVFRKILRIHSLCSRKYRAIPSVMLTGPKRLFDYILAFEVFRE